MLACTRASAWLQECGGGCDGLQQVECGGWLPLHAVEAMMDYCKQTALPPRLHMTFADFRVCWDLQRIVAGLNHVQHHKFLQTQKSYFDYLAFLNRRLGAWGKQERVEDAAEFGQFGDPEGYAAQVRCWGGCTAVILCAPASGSGRRSGDLAVALQHRELLAAPMACLTSLSLMPACALLHHFRQLAAMQSSMPGAACWRCIRARVLPQPSDGGLAGHGSCPGIRERHGTVL